MFDTNEAVQAVEAVDTNEAVETYEVKSDNNEFWNKVFSGFDENVWKNRRLFEAAVELGREMERGDVSTNFVPSALSAYEIKQSAEAVTKAERALLMSAKENTGNLLEKLVAYAVRTTINSGARYVYLSRRYGDDFAENVLEACSLKFVDIDEQYDNRSILNVEFELTNDLRCLAESLGFNGKFVGECDYDGEQVEAYIGKQNDIYVPYNALKTTYDLDNKTVTEQYEAYRAFNEKLQELVTKLYTQ